MTPSPKAMAEPRTDGATVNPEYPVLDPRALGALKLAWRMANEPDDWTRGGEMSSAWDRWTGYPYMAKFTYDLTFCMRVLAKVAQEVPAWREICVDAMDKVLARNCTYAAIFDWVEQKGLDPNCGRYPYFYYKHFIPRGYAGVYNAPGYAGNGLATQWAGMTSSLMLAPAPQNNRHPYFPPHSPGVGRTYDPDPIHGNGSSNMMFRGYFLEQIGLVRNVSGDARYEGPYEIVYDEELRFSYSAGQIAAGLNEQFLAPMDSNGSLMRGGIDCEVGKAFPACIAAGGLGLVLYKNTAGEDYTAGFNDWFAWAKENIIAGGGEPGGPFEWCAPYYDRDLGYLMNLPENQVPLFWTCGAAHMLPHDRAYAERVYEGAIRNYGRIDPESGGLRLVHSPEIAGNMLIEDIWGTSSAITCAHELGDTERLTQLLAWADEAWQPVAEDGEFAYHFNLGEPWPRGIPNHFAQMAFAGGPGSLSRIYEPMDARRFAEPTVCGIDYPTVTVPQAYYDRERRTLVVSIGPGSGQGASDAATSFDVANVEPSSVTLTCDGVPFDNWSPSGPDRITVRTDVRPHAFVLASAP